MSYHNEATRTKSHDKNCKTEYPHVKPGIAADCTCTNEPPEQLGHNALEDTVNHPSHYNSHPTGTECIDIVEHFSFNVGNAIKYLWRAGLKSPDPREDLHKAEWYCARELKRLHGEHNDV